MRVVGQRILVLEEGKVVQQGSQSDLVQRPRRLCRRTVG